MYNVLFICTANICRTPIAKYYLKKLIKEANLDNEIASLSAGTWAMDGHPAVEFSQQICLENGFDCSEHIANTISTTLMEEADLILCMNKKHKADLTGIFPQHISKTFLLTEYKNTDKKSIKNINDPYGRNYDFYKKVYLNITKEIDRVFNTFAQMRLRKNTFKEGMFAKRRW